MVPFTARRTSLVLIVAAACQVAQVHCGKVFFPSSNEAPDTHPSQETHDQSNIQYHNSEPRGIVDQQSEDDTISLTHNDAIEEDDQESSAEARGLSDIWESDLFFLQKLSGLFGGGDKPKRRRVHPQSLAHRRNGLQNPQHPNQIGGQKGPMRHPAAPANTLTAPRPYLDAQVQQLKANSFAVINVPPQPKPVKPVETIEPVAPEESFPYQFVRPDNTGASINIGKPTKQQPSAPVFKGQPVLTRNTFSANIPKPALLNGPDPIRKTAVVRNHLNNHAPNSILQLGSLNAPSSIPLSLPQQAVVPQTIIGQQTQIHSVRKPFGGIMTHPTPPQPFQSFKVSSSIGLGGQKQKPGTVQNVNFVKQAVPPKQSFLNSQIDPTFINKPQFVNKPAVTKKPAMSFLDNLASMAGSVTSVFNPKPPKTQHPRPAPNPQRVFHQPPPTQPQPTKPTSPPFNPSLQFNPSPQEGNSLLSDAFQPVFIASPSLDEELDRDLMKPIYVEGLARAPDIDTSSNSVPELVDFF